jgi:hypothetical protein
VRLIVIKHRDFGFTAPAPRHLHRNDSIEVATRHSTRFAIEVRTPFLGVRAEKWGLGKMTVGGRDGPSFSPNPVYQPELRERALGSLIGQSQIINAVYSRGGCEMT